MDGTGHLCYGMLYDGIRQRMWRDVEKMSQTKGKRWLLAGACLALLAGGGWFLYRTGFFAAMTSAEAMTAYIQQFHPFGEAAFFLVQLLSVLLPPIPNNVLALAGSVVFGLAKSFLLTILAIYLGSLLVFLLARQFGKPFVRALARSDAYEKYLHLLRARHDFFFVMVLLLPWFPDDLFCLCMGLTDIPLRRFMTIVILARPWGILFASTLGSVIMTLPWWAIGLLLAATGVFLLLGLRYGERLERWLIGKFHKERQDQP